METFRCPTCTAVLTDPHARRCPACKQRLRRRSPRVLGEETRLTSKVLPVDRWMMARLDHVADRVRDAEPVAWQGRFQASPALPAVAPEYPAFPAARPDGYLDDVRDVGLADPGFGEYSSPAVEFGDPVAASVSPLALDAYVPHPADGHREPREEREPGVAPDPLASVAEPESSPRPLAHAELDPEIRALVDDLYERARAEITGEAAAAPAIDLSGRDSGATRAEDPRAEPGAPGGRSRWVPAFVADERRRKRLSD